jgi:hypothetical protein
MKRTDFIKYLGTHECILLREGGKHSIFINNRNGKISSIPRHHEIFENTCKEICKQFGIPQITSK